MEIVLWGVGGLVGAFALDRVLLWMESRQWINYRRTGLSRAGPVYHALELHSVFEPGMAEVQEVRVREERQESEAGAPPTSGGAPSPDP